MARTPPKAAATASDPTERPPLLVGSLQEAFAPSLAAVLAWRAGGVASVRSLLGRLARCR